MKRLTIVIICVALVLLWVNYSYVLAVDEPMWRFCSISLKYCGIFKYNYPHECKMPDDMNYFHGDYMKRWLHIRDQLHDRPAALRFHQWLANRGWVNIIGTVSNSEVSNSEDGLLGVLAMVAASIVPFFVQVVLF